MALEQKLSLKLAQKLVMTPSLQQAIKLLQMTRMELDTLLTQELVENPVLEELCRRIAKQERRHFAYYFNQSKDKLSGRPFDQKFVKFIANKFYAPVGGGVKTDEAAARTVAALFPGNRIFEVMGYIEKKMALLPGMADLQCATRCPP